MFTTVSMYPKQKFQHDVVIEYYIETNMKQFEIYQKIYRHFHATICVQ